MRSSNDFTLILVVDTNPLVAEGLDAVLSRRRGLMAVAAEVNAAVRILPGLTAPKDVAPEIALVDPAAVAASVAELVAANPDLALVAYLPADRTAEARHCMAAGFRGVLSKTSPADTILAALHLVAQGGVYLDAPFAATASGTVTVSPTLSDREISVLRGLAQGMSAKEIGQALQLSGKTVETYKARAATKLNLRGRREIVDFVLRSGWIAAHP